MFSSASDKEKLFAKNFTKKLNLDSSGLFLPAFSSRTYPKLHNINLAPKLVKKIITNHNSLKAFVLDCISVVVLEKCESELSYILAELFIILLQESCFPNCVVPSIVPVFKNIWDRSKATNYSPVI